MDVVAVFRRPIRDCDGGRASGGPGANRCGDCLEGYVELRGLCLPKSGVYDEDEYSQRDMCELLRGGFAENDAVCVNADADGTFCVLDSTGEDPVFPCRGLFRRVLYCNLTYHRPGKNPFVCGGRCEDEEVAQGGGCWGDGY